MELETNKVYNEDCLSLMELMPDDFCNITVTSPPYNFNLRIHYGQYRKRSVNEVTKYSGSYSDNLSMEDYFEWQKKCISEMLRVTKNYVFYNIQMITGNKVALFKLLGYFSENIKEVFIWDKINSEPAIMNGVLNSQFEFVIVFSKNAINRQFDVCNFERGTLSNVLKIHKKMNNKNSDVHNACFPDKLPYELIRYFSNENDLVYDPFMGTGTTAKVCVVLNRKYIGSEINYKYCDVIESELYPYENNLFKSSP